MDPIKIKLGDIQKEKNLEIQHWCKENFGTIGYWKDHLNKNARWSVSRNQHTKEVTYFFFDEKDATMFSLKWAGMPTNS